MKGYVPPCTCGKPAAAHECPKDVEALKLQIEELRSTLKAALGPTDPATVDGNRCYSIALGGKAYADLLAFSQGKEIKDWYAEKRVDDPLKAKNKEINRLQELVARDHCGHCKCACTDCT